MITNLSSKELISFENKVADAFNSGKIKAPVHLYSNNEADLITYFKKVKKEDWITCSWRSHYQCLLKGVPQEILYESILKGNSISLCFPDYNIYSSAIVGGHISIAVGIALSLKLENSSSFVHCFLGDMTAETGIFHEAFKYSTNFDLPIRFIIEDNELSVCTDTKKAWGTKNLWYTDFKSDKIYYYKYKNKYPHAGAGVRVQF